ncbi:MAG: hypothetical protein QG614_144 [Patescibacteria group bacterium]|nr:hypothetical protein [Patescibacteria group bacterium]
MTSWKELQLECPKKKPEDHKQVRIALSVCACYASEKVILVANKAARVANILGITVLELECFVIHAILTAKLQVVACYVSHDIAEIKLALLEAEYLFIARSCHSFQLLPQE